MTKKTTNAMPAIGTPRQPPVRVKLGRPRCGVIKSYPPDGETRAWWDRLKKALGTSSSAFVNASLIELQVAARLPFNGVSETALNAALAMVEATAPRDEIEGALAVQMACTHTAAMAVLARLTGGASERRVAALGSAAARLLRAYSTQVEVLRRLRRGGGQLVRVEHVHINDGGQAVIGNVAPRNGQRRPTCPKARRSAPAIVSGRDL
jgi:hypothetical protein